MKRKIAALVVFVALAVMSISGTMAYFTADGTATNVITAGNISIELLEQQKNADGTLTQFEDKTGIMPGQQISKIVTVANTGDNDAYVRIAVDTVVKLASGAVSIEGKDLVACDFNTIDWVKGGDGFYYYAKSLAPGAETEPLFTAVTFSPAMGNAYQNCTATIDVAAYAVQVKNNGATVFEAAGWPNPVAE